MKNSWIYETIRQIKTRNSKNMIHTVADLGDTFEASFAWKGGFYYEDEKLSLKEVVHDLIDMYHETNSWDLKEAIVDALSWLNIHHEDESKEFYELYHQVLKPLDKLNHCEVSEIDLQSLQHIEYLIESVSDEDFLEKYEIPFIKLKNTVYSEAANYALAQLEILRKLKNLKNLSITELKDIVENENLHYNIIVKKSKELLAQKLNDKHI